MTDLITRLEEAADMKCPKCNARSGDDWEQCKGSCPLPGSPYFESQPQGQAMTDTVRVPRAWLEAFRRDTNPTEPIADNGGTGWDMFCHEASAMLAASPQGEGSSAAPIPTETDDAAVLDRVYWLCDGAQPGDYGAVIAAIRDAVLPTSYDELLRALTEMLAAYRGAVLLTADDELQRCADKAEALITKITEGA